MDGHGRDQVSRRSYNNNNNNQITASEEELIMDHDDDEVKRGAWTVEEDFTLINYVAHHGEGRWNSLARCAGLKRRGKSCRLRWLNYLRPDVRRGNITLEEQLLILELHSRWGNRWSKIAQHLPGRTDNEIKNYWRTRVQKHAKQLKCDVNSKQFKDAMRYLWMPRLIERIQAANKTTTTCTSSTLPHNNNPHDELTGSTNQNIPHHLSYAPENSSSDSFGTAVSDLTESYNNYTTLDHGIIINNNIQDFHHQQQQASTSSTADYFNQERSGFVEQNTQCPIDISDNFWDNIDDIWFLHHQFN